MSEHESDSSRELATKGDVDTAADRVIDAFQENDNTDLNEPGLRKMLLGTEQRILAALNLALTKKDGTDDGS